MNNSFKLFAALLLAGGFALSLSSCKDSEDAANGNGPTPEEIAQSKDSESAKGLLSVLSFTSQLDSLPDNWYAGNYTVEPTVGTVNDQSTPFVRYVPVLNKEEAIAKYNSIADQEMPNGNTSASWSIENVGSVRFNVLDQADCIATLDLNIRQQPHLTQIRFVPVSAMGDNASLKGEPFYDFGDVVELKEAENVKTYWICVRPCSQKEKKSTSHWISFNINGSYEEEKGVPEKSINIKKITKNRSLDYYLPTQLGNKSESREHIQNLFKLLYVLDNPARYTESKFPDGIGGISREEFTMEKLEQISYLWNDLTWSFVLPPFVKRTDIQSLFCGERTDINVFYYGYHYNRLLSNASVHRVKLTTENFDLKSDEIKWSRGINGVDFRNYAEYGSKRAFEYMNDIEALPEQGLVVRYKTGRQLIGGGSGNDEDPTSSFTVNHSDIIQNLRARREYMKNREWGASEIGDRITRICSDANDPDYNTGYCVWRYSAVNPKYMGNNSYYLRPKRITKQNEGNGFALLDRQESTLSYITVLNALMCENGLSRYLDCEDSYIEALNKFREVLAQGVPKEQWVNFFDFSIVDANGIRKDHNDGNINNIAKVSINMYYTDSDLEKGQYRRATIEFDVNDKTYTIKPHTVVYSAKAGDYMVELYPVVDIDPLGLSLKPGQTFVIGIGQSLYDIRRGRVHSACTSFLESVLSRIK